MKTLIVTFLMLSSLNLHAISFIKPEEVKEHLQAEEVNEASKYKVEKFVDSSKECSFAFRSRSGRAYIVKIESQLKIYATPSSLDGLKDCGDISEDDAKSALEND